MELVKFRKRNFLKKKVFSRYLAVAFKIWYICCNQSTIKKWELKDQEMRNIYLIKTTLKRMARMKRVHMQIMLKGGNKHATIIYDTCSKLSIRVQKSVIYFHFKQRSIIPVMSLLLTFNKYTASGVCLFQYPIFMFQNIISQSEHKFTSEHLKRNKQKMSAGKKTIKEKQTILLESMRRCR